MYLTNSAPLINISKFLELLPRYILLSYVIIGSLLLKAQEKQDENILRELSWSDAVAREVRYHVSCYIRYCENTKWVGWPTIVMLTLFDSN
jgi:hypothetical protein